MDSCIQPQQHSINASHGMDEHVTKSWIYFSPSARLYNMATFERLQLGRNRFVLEQGIALGINGVNDLFVMLGSSLPV
jgi:hypothetical protein